MIYEAVSPQCWRSVVQVLVVRVDIGVVTYESMTPQCGRSVVQVLVVRVDIGVVIYEAMTAQCGRSVVQVLVVRVDIGVVTYEAMTPQCGRSVVQVLVVFIRDSDFYKTQPISIFFFIQYALSHELLSIFPVPKTSEVQFLTCYNKTLSTDYTKGDHTSLTGDHTQADNPSLVRQGATRRVHV